MSGTPQLVFPIDLGTSFGPLLAAVFLSCALWGAQTSQTLVYYTSYPKDSLLLKAFVFVIYGLSTAHLIVIAKGVWIALITNFGSLGVSTPELTYQCFFTSVAALSVQTFFLIRIYQFSKITPHAFFKHAAFRFGFPLLMLPLMCFQAAAYIYYGARLLMFPTIAEEERQFNMAIAINATVVTVDLSISLVTCIMLYLSQTGFKGTNRIIKGLIFVSLNSGIWTSLFAILILAMLLNRTDLMYAIFDLSIMGTYCNTIMGNLNSRNFIARNPDDSDFAVSTFNVIPLDNLKMPVSNTAVHGKSSARTASTKLNSLGQRQESSRSNDFKAANLVEP